jgi:hypothetical protein
MGPSRQAHLPRLSPRPGECEPRDSVYSAETGENDEISAQSPAMPSPGHRVLCGDYRHAPVGMPNTPCKGDPYNLARNLQLLSILANWNMGDQRRVALAGER